MVKSFGIDEMTALAGGSQTEEMAAFRPSTGLSQLGGHNRGKKKTLPNEQPDFSTMSAAETAAMLMGKNAGKGGANNQQLSSSSSRYRTNRVLAHHALAQELSEELQFRQHQQDQKKNFPKSREGPIESGSEDEFTARRGAGARRARAAPQIVSGRSKDERVVADASTQHRRKRRNSDSSSASSSSDDSKRHRRPVGRRRRDGDDSSSSSDEEDRRRARLRASRARQEPQIIQTVSQAPIEKRETIAKESTAKKMEHPPKQSESSVAVGDAVQQRKTIKKQRSESSSEDSSRSGGSSSSSEDDCSSEEEPVISKPIFVPKHKRNLLQSEEKKWEEEEVRAEREKKRTESRKMESRAMVAQTVAAVQASNMDDDNMDEEGGGATNAPPNDDDGIDVEQERDAWEVRELRRLLNTMDEMKQREKVKLEYERRKQMTDEEVLQHDMKTGRYLAPGSNREGDSTGGKHMQRFYHRGAFYMAEDEWDENDVRHKAADYAKAATGDDKVDRSALPEVMQVKGFGFARQNTRYKGLAKEDTSDKKQEFLPLVHNKK